MSETGAGPMTGPDPELEPAAGTGAAPGPAAPAPVAGPAPARDEEPSWWHRSHPTFAGVAGFFTGIVYVIVVPGIYATLLNAFLGEKTATRLFPYVLVVVLVPIGLLVPRKTRRFAQLMLVGMVATVLVVAVTAALVLWVLVSLDK
jgi:hypothetical protein